MDDSKWRGTYKTLKQYYAGEYGITYLDPVSQKQVPYFYFDKYELEIDPDETMDSVEHYDAARQQKEIIKCATSFAYFCHKYVKILHPMYGLIPFILYGYQRNVIRDYEDYRFNIISKFRQGGLTTVTLLWGMWRCMFKLDQQIMLLSKTDREATDIGLMVDRAIENMPTWMKPKKDAKWNDHLKMFTDTGGALKFYSPEAARGKSVTFLIIDEAAFISDMETHWKAMWPVLSTGGSCALVSTVNGLGNWYYEIYMGAKDERNKFHVIDLDYWEHPDYNNPSWVEEQKAQLGEKGFAQEVMRSFLGSGETYIPAAIIGALDRQTRDQQQCLPIRKLFRDWVNTGGRIGELESLTGMDRRGAMWLWKEPMDGHEYIMGVDTADGMGENGDSSCFQIIDTATLEQVAEFYSNTIPPHIFAQVVNETALYFNSALVVVENMGGSGGAVLNILQHELYYENLFYESKGLKNANPGLRVGPGNRMLLLQAMQHRLLNSTMRVNSIRFVNELKTFEYNPVTRKAEAQKGKHDDAIMAISIALYVRDGVLRDIPMGAEVPKEITAAFKTAMYENIKKEIQDGAPENELEEDFDLLRPEADAVLPGVMFNVQRRYDKLLKEFGW